MQELIANTNVKLLAARKLETNLDEIRKFIGIRLFMCLQPIHGEYRDYWNTPESSTSRSGCTAHNFGGRFGMSRHRFDDLKSHLALCAPQDPTEEKV